MERPYKNITFTEKYLFVMPPLYKNVFNLKQDVKEIWKKFFHPYQAIRASTMTLFGDNNTVASFYGVIVQKAIYQGRIFYIGQSCDSMTHKEHGGKRLFVNLADLAYKNLESNGINFVYGFPNKTIYDLRMKKLLWQHSEDIHVLKSFVSTLPVAKLVKKIPFLKPLYVTYLNVILGRYKSKSTFFSNSVITEEVGGIVHDHEYFDYKKTKDKFIINIEGVNLWVKYDGYMWIGDMEIVTDEKLRIIIGKLRRLAMLAGCTAIVFHYQANSVMEVILNKHLTLTDRMPLGTRVLKGMAPGPLHFSGSDFDSW